MRPVCCEEGTDDFVVFHSGLNARLYIERRLPIITLECVDRIADSLRAAEAAISIKFIADQSLHPVLIAVANAKEQGFFRGRRRLMGAEKKPENFLEHVFPQSVVGLEP